MQGVSGSALVTYTRVALDVVSLALVLTAHLMPFDERGAGSSPQAITPARK